jgi:hypothetical protein
LPRRRQPKGPEQCDRLLVSGHCTMSSTISPHTGYKTINTPHGDSRL